MKLSLIDCLLSPARRVLAFILRPRDGGEPAGVPALRPKPKPSLSSKAKR